MQTAFGNAISLTMICGSSLDNTRALDKGQHTKIADGHCEVQRKLQEDSPAPPCTPILHELLRTNRQVSLEQCLRQSAARPVGSCARSQQRLSHGNGILTVRMSDTAHATRAQGSPGSKLGGPSPFLPAQFRITSDHLTRQAPASFRVNVSLIHTMYTASASQRQGACAKQQHRTWQHNEKCITLQTVHKTQNRHNISIGRPLSNAAGAATFPTVQASQWSFILPRLKTVKSGVTTAAHTARSGFASLSHH